MCLGIVNMCTCRDMYNSCTTMSASGDIPDNTAGSGPADRFTIFAGMRLLPLLQLSSIYCNSLSVFAMLFVPAFSLNSKFCYQDEQVSLLQLHRHTDVNIYVLFFNI